MFADCKTVSNELMNVIIKYDVTFSLTIFFKVTLLISDKVNSFHFETSILKQFLF